MTRSSGRPLLLAIVTIAVVVVGAGILVASAWSPTVPGDAATTVIARTALVGDIAPDMSTTDDPTTPPRSPAGQECLPAIERAAGTLSLCWEAYREPADADPDKDYYRLRVYGTFGGETGSGVRWATVRVRLVVQPADGVFDAWPSGTIEGPCRPVEVDLFGPVGIEAGSPGSETVCGRTSASTDEGDWSQRVTWTCVGCLIPDHADRSIALHEWVGVPEGTVPTWEIFADLGG